MGIKDLWTILTPFCERKPLFDLQGKVVAVDLSGWVCQAQCITEHHIQPRMYLRNLYFRTCFLLLQEVSPVFVLEGEAPTLKYKTIAARNQIQFKGAKPRAEGTTKAPAKGRSRFHHVLKQCEEMIKHMGLACVTGRGEAEAMCAYLNEEGMVDGCISQDSDCFAYGAYVVYRNFSISQQGPHAASGGSVDVYDIRKATQATDFGRNKVIALALLCGSDYNEGVFGIGKDSALKFFDTVSDDRVLDRIISWRANNKLYDDLERKHSDKNVCTQCGHVGKKASHTRSGCGDCGMRSGCRLDSGFSEKRLEVKNEINIRSKALEDPEFPCKELMGEFLVRKDSVEGLNLKWKRPDMRKFVKFTAKHLQWDEVYCFEKFLPVLTRWTVLHYKSYKEGVDIKPDYIKKCRNPKGVSSYEIIWQCDIFKDLLPNSQLAGVDPIKLFSTIEPQDLVMKAYPDVVEAYQLSKVKPKKPKRAKKAAKTKASTLENFVVRKPVLDDSEMSCFGDEDNEADLSLVVEDIINRGLPRLVREKLSKLVRAIETSDIKLPQNVADLNSSSFFMGLGQSENDLFEATCNRPVSSDDDSSDSDEIRTITNCFDSKAITTTIDKHENRATKISCKESNARTRINIFDNQEKIYDGVTTENCQNRAYDFVFSDDDSSDIDHSRTITTSSDNNKEIIVSRSYNKEIVGGTIINRFNKKIVAETTINRFNEEIIAGTTINRFNKEIVAGTAITSEDIDVRCTKTRFNSSKRKENNHNDIRASCSLHNDVMLKDICDNRSKTVMNKIAVTSYNEINSEDDKCGESIEEKCDFDDTFDEVYVPLYERLKNKK